MGPRREFLLETIQARVSTPAFDWLVGTARAVAVQREAPPDLFPTLISQCSRHLPREPLAPTAADLERAVELLPGWNPERWSVLDAARAALVLSRADLEQEGAVRAIEECFRYADLGELVALHRTLALMPDSKRFTARAREGCRSSMRSVFEAAACDTPLPFAHFDDDAWRQLVIKALFVEAPLWRVYGLDRRLDAELARMALDLSEERRSASRPVQHELWLCLGRHGGERGRVALEAELAGTYTPGRRAAAVALARAGEIDRLRALYQQERDSAVRATMHSALAGCIDQSAFQDLETTLPG